NITIEKLTHLIRYVYRNIQENITGTYPRIYRQVRAGAEIAAIAKNKEFFVPEDDLYTRLNNIPVIRQILLYPPLVLNPPMNKRSGEFIKIDANPLELIDIDNSEWLCYPAKVGKLNILIYFHIKFFELGFSLCNLFELSSGKDLECKPDGIYLFGVEENSLDRFGDNPAVFYDDLENDLLIAAVPRRDDFGYFGYLKKMILTLHNIKMMKNNCFPFHGALVQLNFRKGLQKTLLIIGDTGAGKSELIEAFRIIGKDDISDITVIADDMGSVEIDKDKNIKGYGTEIGAFLRLDDLQQGYAFGQMDRSIFMNPSLTNARIVLPLTSFKNIIRGVKIDYFLYANNYEQIDEEHPIIEKIESCDDAIKLFSEGAVMSKGTTASTGLIHSYYANIFGPPQFRELHEKLALKYFREFYKNKVFVGQIRTRLGVKGFERKGPEEAARELLKVLL
ncbi:phosphoenolpyruvate carboxykinase, partial [Actinomycetota bacterium]